jgi:ATP synthase protein I
VKKTLLTSHHEMEHRPASGDNAPAPGGDPWAAFGYLVAGVLFYGGLGWGLSIWLNATYWIPIGILVGAGLGLYLVFSRYRVRETGAGSERDPASGAGAAPPAEITQDSHDAPLDDEAALNKRPAPDDRGETA